MHNLPEWLSFLNPLDAIQILGLMALLAGSMGYFLAWAQGRRRTQALRDADEQSWKSRLEAQQEEQAGLLREREQAWHQERDSLIHEQQLKAHDAEGQQELLRQRLLQQEQHQVEQQAQWQQQLLELRQERQEQQQAAESWRQQHDQARLRLQEMETREAEREQQVAEQLRLLNENREHLRQEFENLSHQIFEAKGKAFTEQSQQNMAMMLKPFREQLGEFKTRVEDIHHRDVKQKAELSAELQQLKALNQAMTQEAHDLSTALRGQKKTQGNWGELMLENVLERSGLQLGRDYQREVSFQTEDGKRRPDVIVNLPQGRHLVIDAKVSLNAYQDYVNAEDENQRSLKLREHVAALSSRIQDLSSKRYFELPGLRSPEIVFMFVPIESAFVEALKADSDLFQRALQNEVLVATPTTLLTSLNIVRQLWRFEAQSRSSAELADKAAKVHDKLRLFLQSMEGVGSQIEKAHDTWRKACNQLSEGRGNLIKQAQDFKELGVAVKAELPESFSARAELELSSEGLAENPPTPAGE